MKLLKRTVKSYLIYSLLVLVAAIPLSYFIIQSLCLQDVDEALHYRKTNLGVQLKSRNKILTQLPWHDLSNGIFIYPPVNKTNKEKTITTQYYNTQSGEEEPFRELHTILKLKGRTYPVIFRISLINIEDLIQGIILTEIMLIIAILGGLLWINRQQSKKLWFPFYQALKKLQYFSLDKKPDLELVPTNIDEFKDLQKEIIQLTERTYQTYLQQKEFTENAAHEIQTPLATFQAKLDLFIQDETLTQTQFNYIQSLSDSVLRVSKLSRALLLLAKIENKQFQEMKEVAIVPVIKKLRNQLEVQIKLKQLTVSASYEKEIVVKTDPILIDILFSNLLNNAVQHTPKGGNIKIVTHPNQILICNAGNVLPFPEEKLFRRFQRGNSSKASGGNGLGLAIVKQICEVCHFSIHHQYNDNQHCFILLFRK